MKLKDLPFGIEIIEKNGKFYPGRRYYIVEGIKLFPEPKEKD